MRCKKVKAVFRKEIKEFLRDKKNLVTMFVIPLVMYPLLIFVILAVVAKVETGYETRSYKVSFDQNIEQDIEDAILGEGGDAEASLSKVEVSDPKLALSSGDTDVVILKTDDGYTVEYYMPRSDSEHARELVSERLEEIKKKKSETLISDAGLNEKEILEPFEVENINTASDESSAGSILGMILPMLLMIGVFTGVMNPAVDMTAGEKERGTMETLLSMPLNGQEIICGKFLTVAVIGAFSSFMYLISMGMIAGCGVAFFNMMDIEMPAIDATAFVPSILVVALTVIVFSLLLSAVIMCICTFAKSVKEASGRVAPMMSVIMLVSYLGFLDLQLTVPLSIVPVLNIILLIKSVLTFEYEALPIALVLLSNIAYAAIGVAILGKLFTSDRILFGGQGMGILDRPERVVPGSVPSIGDMTLVLAVTSVLFIYAGSLLQVKYLLPGVGLSQLILIGVPLLAAWYGRVDMKKTFSLKKVNLKTILVSVAIGIAVFFVFNGLMDMLSGFIDESAESYAETMVNLMEGKSLPEMLFFVAVVPAICEETLFRGYIFSSIKAKAKPWLAVAITAVLFGIYHMNLFQGIYAACLGTVLALAVHYTGSIFPSMIIHFTANSMAVIMSIVVK